jgi:hypothetical protein
MKVFCSAVLLLCLIAVGLWTAYMLAKVVTAGIMRTIRKEKETDR